MTRKPKPLVIIAAALLASAATHPTPRELTRWPQSAEALPLPLTGSRRGDRASAGCAEGLSATDKREPRTKNVTWLTLSNAGLLSQGTSS